MSSAATARRFAAVDALRGLAFVPMIAFHFVYTLEQFGLTEIDVHRDPPWVAWRVAIVSQFLLLVGVSQTLRARDRDRWNGGTGHFYFGENRTSVLGADIPPG